MQSPRDILAFKALFEWIFEHFAISANKGEIHLTAADEHNHRMNTEQLDYTLKCSLVALRFHRTRWVRG